MSYRIDSSPTYRGHGAVQSVPDATIVLVGCGGTGSFLAEALCRLLISRPADVYLVDMDRVEPHNVGRQAFDLADVGRFKVQVLAEHLACRFERTVGYAVQPYDAALHAHVFRTQTGRLRLLIGCVDKPYARRAIAATLEGQSGAWWLDCGNGRNSGQVLLGNATRGELLREAFDARKGLCRALPAPHLQRPDLLDAPPAPVPAPDCAEAVALHEQGGTINQVMAAIAASTIERLLDGTCTAMASYVDMDDGTLRAVHAEPKGVAHIVGMRQASLMLT